MSETANIPRAEHIAEELENSLEHAGFGPAGQDPLRRALVRVAARFAEVVTGHIEAAPALHLAAFEKLLKRSAPPTLAAQTFLTFKPAAGGTDTPCVPMHTNVAASSGIGGIPPVFETLSDLDLARLEPVLLLQAGTGHLAIADDSSRLTPPAASNPLVVPPAPPRPLIRALHFGHNIAFGAVGLREVVLHIEVDQPAPASLSFEWGITTREGFLPLRVCNDLTEGLHVSGTIALAPPTQWPSAVLYGQESRWLSVLARGEDPGERPLRLRRISVDTVVETAAVPLKLALHDGQPLDATRDFYPLGDHPGFGATFQLFHPDFALPGARIELQIVMTNPVDARDAPLPPVTRAGRPRIEWEISTANGYRSLAASDSTRDLTQSGSVSFAIPGDATAAGVPGQRVPCVRARLHRGSYELEARAGTAATCAPMLKSVTVKSSQRRVRLSPERLLSQGGLVARSVDCSAAASFPAFPEPGCRGPALYVALAGPDTRQGVSRRLAVLVQPVPPAPPLVVGGLEDSNHSAAPTWQCRVQGAWRDLTVIADGSKAFTRRGIVQLDIPNLSEKWPECIFDPRAQYLWLRAVWPPGTPESAACVQGLTLNAVAARHSQILRNELLGSSNARAHQSYRVLRLPMVGPVALQVRENDGWRDWREVEDLSDSGPESCDFVVERSQGEVRFGDGRQGRIPPPGVRNIRMTYCCGGGRSGNVAAGALNRLRTTLPGVDSVTNVVPAVGGLDGGPEAMRITRASVWLRNRDRAVCVDDFAQLALRASPLVARAYAHGARGSPDVAVKALFEDYSTVSVIVLPHEGGARPQPDDTLLRIVKDYLDPRRSLAARVVVMGPSYVPVCVAAEITIAPDFSRQSVIAECIARIAAFLHPVTGGDGNKGWTPGQRPHRSDLFALLRSVAGVHLVRALSLNPDKKVSDPFVIAAGDIAVTADE